MDIRDGVKMGHLVLSQLHMAVCLYFQIGIQAHLIGFRPVSYTHLDVYKRQVWNNAPQTNSARTDLILRISY